MKKRRAVPKQVPSAAATATTTLPLAQPVAFNVGGRRFALLRSTIVARAPDSLLARIAAGTSGMRTLRDAEGAYFFDRDGDAFAHVVEWLRNGRLRAGSYNVEQLRDEFEYWAIDGALALLPQPLPAALLREVRIEAVREALQDASEECLVSTVARLADTFIDTWGDTLVWQSRSLGTSDALVCMHRGLDAGFVNRYAKASNMREPRRFTSVFAETPVYSAWIEQISKDTDAEVRHVFTDIERYTFINRLTEAQISAVVAEVKRLVASPDEMRRAYTFETHNDGNIALAFTAWRDGVIGKHVETLRKDKAMRRSFFPKPSAIFEREHARAEWTRAMQERGFSSSWMRGAVDGRRSKWINELPGMHGPIVIVFDDKSEHCEMRSQETDEDRLGARADLVDVCGTLASLGTRDRLVWLCRVSWAMPLRPAPVFQTSVVDEEPPAATKKRRRVDDGGGE